MRFYGLDFKEQDDFFECMEATKLKTILQKLTPESSSSIDLLNDVTASIQVNGQSPMIEIDEDLTAMAFGFKWNPDVSPDDRAQAKEEYDKFFNDNFPSQHPRMMTLTEWWQ